MKGNKNEDRNMTNGIKNGQTDGYDESDIQVLEGLRPSESLECI